MLRKVSMICNEAKGRLGELTLRGAEQHQQIARRMYERFPEVFRGKTHIDAKSSTVVRCILSMENALHQFIRINPQLQITHAASEHDMQMCIRDSAKNGCIVLALDKKLKGDEAYHISVSNKTIRVTGKTPKGVFYGIQTLRKSLAEEIHQDAIVDVYKRQDYYRMGWIKKAPNPNLRWEKTKDMKVSIDAGFLNDRIRMTGEIYKRIPSDAVSEVFIPYSTGFRNQ